jgi:glycosyltransferase involved in cell wall biosynthesis
VGDRSYYLSEPQAGIVVRPAGDPEALSNGIIQVLDNPDLAQKLRSNGLELVKRYTWDKLAAQLEQEYLKLL